MPRPRAAEPVSSRHLIALLGVVDGARSVREVQLVGGWRSKQTAHEAMRALQDVHLIDWEAGKAGTLRALVYRVPVDLTPLSVE